MGLVGQEVQVATSHEEEEAEMKLRNDRYCVVCGRSFYVLNPEIRNTVRCPKCDKGATDSKEV